MLNDAIQNSKVLIVDDQQANVTLLERVLRQAGYCNHRSTTDSREACFIFDEFQPDLVLLDLLMPYLDGFGVLNALQLRIPRESYLPIAILSADISQAAKSKALSLGAKDFITKPFDNAEVALRIGSLLHTRCLHRELEQQNQILDRKVRDRTRNLEEAQVEILRRLALAAEYRDDDTGQHTRRVGELAALLGRCAGLPDAGVELVRMAAPLHDVGKIGIPDSVLLKPAKLTAAEYELVKTHTSIGANMLSGSRFPVLQLAERIALYHHEHWNGNGYWGLYGETIPVEARIVSIADTFDVLTHDRPYKKAWDVDAAVAEIQSHSGRQFDPELVRVFMEALHCNSLLLLSGEVENSAPGSPKTGESIIPSINELDEQSSLV